MKDKKTKEARYAHYIRVPFAGAIIAAVECDEPYEDGEADPDVLHQLFVEQNEDALASLRFEGQLEVHEWETYGRTSQGWCDHLSLTEVVIDETEDRGEEE